MCIRDSKKRVHFLLRDDLRQLDHITQEVTLISKKNITNLSEDVYKRQR